ncbi:uncharacterized protein SCHCODRAFT_02047452 [Schizophyllum commune H4-8]|uniref:uncharacterized protein n=1 Tax=Schizophyllum commune (strain H4-8 / FGSC 9210) TaxID=578458 RepID=UPI0021605897|nr:uncharacterized protein SCHCODRAFT_02047452 [Schizophyllum commune H4-8]KAI5888170.1 hypothetical protein SCHCODRAFT_02047452 [Schizophyllum commune H4-8]
MSAVLFTTSSIVGFATCLDSEPYWVVAWLGLIKVHLISESLRVFPCSYDTLSIDLLVHKESKFNCHELVTVMPRCRTLPIMPRGKAASTMHTIKAVCAPRRPHPQEHPPAAKVSVLAVWNAVGTPYGPSLCRNARRECPRCVGLAFARSDTAKISDRATSLNRIPTLQPYLPRPSDEEHSC